MTVLMSEDLVSRKWVTHRVSVEETPNQVEPPLTQALEVEGAAGRRARTGRRAIPLDVSDHGSQMTARNTRRFMAMLAIAQHFGRPSTPTDQARVE